MKWNEFKSVVDKQIVGFGLQDVLIDSMDFNLDMDDDGMPFTFRVVLQLQNDPATIRIENNPPKYT
jgi:hypothetical protein